MCCSQVQDQGDQKMVDPNSTDRSKVQNIEAGNISNENAERRANTPASEQSFTSIQAFDGVGECLPKRFFRQSSSNHFLAIFASVTF